MPRRVGYLGLSHQVFRYDAAEVEKILLPIPAVADQAAEQ